MCVASAASDESRLYRLYPWLSASAATAIQPSEVLNPDCFLCVHPVVAPGVSLVGAIAVTMLLWYRKDSRNRRDAASSAAASSSKKAKPVPGVITGVTGSTPAPVGLKIEVVSGQVCEGGIAEDATLQQPQGCHSPVNYA